MKKRKRLRIRKPELVTEYLENLASEGLEEHADIVRKFVGQRIGIYALYRRGKLYYAGLASDLQWRLKHHLRDRHKDHWDTLSVYLTIGDKHLRELESLVLRIMQPPGNKQLGKFAGAQDLYRKFNQQIAEKQRAERARLFGRETSKARKKDALNRGVKVRARYKGKLILARMRKDRRVRCIGKLYSSPSAAASAIRKHPTNGWNFWEYERSPGYWVTIDCLRNENQTTQNTDKLAVIVGLAKAGKTKTQIAAAVKNEHGPLSRHTTYIIGREWRRVNKVGRHFGTTARTPDART